MNGQEKEELRAITCLHRLASEAVVAPDLTTVLEGILNAAMELHRASFGNIQLYDPKTATLAIVAQRNFKDRFLEYFSKVDAEKGSACGMALRERKRIVIEDVETTPAYGPSLLEARAAGYRAVQSTPLITPDGEPLGILSTHFREPRQFSELEHRFTDIIARQAADAIAAQKLHDKLRASETRLRKIVETDVIGVVFFDEGGTLINANDSFLRMTGYSRSEVEDHCLDWRKMTPPEWLEESEKQMSRLIETGRIGPYEKQLFLKDGSKSWVLITGQRIDEDTIVKFCMEIGDRKRAEEQRELLAHELSHRVKNMLAVVQALATQTSGRTRSIEDFREAFLGRLHVLAKAHSLLTDAQWQSADLRALVKQTAELYVDRPEVIEIDGEPVTVTAKQALGLSLVLHELATNAAKYGSLTQQEGRLHVSWDIAHRKGGRHIELQWLERHGPPIEPPTEKGFGTQMIERACSYELNGEVELTYNPEGLTCRIAFPLETTA